MTAAEIAAVVAELAPAVRGARVRDVRRRGESDLVLTLRAPGRNLHLLLSAHRSASRIYLLRERPPGPWRSGAFRDACRHDLRAARIVSIAAVEGDRRVTLSAERLLVDDDGEPRATADVRLEAELYGRVANLLLVDGDGRIREVLRPTEGRRRLVSGEVYRPAPVPSGGETSRSHPPAPPVADEALALNRAAEDRFEAAAAALDAETARARLMKRAAATCARQRRKLQALAARADESSRAEAVRREGELLKGELHRLRRGDTVVTVTDYYQDPPAEVTVHLDPVRTPQQNLAALFKRYRKLRDGAEVTRRLLGEAEDRLLRLDGLLADIAHAADAVAVEAIEREAVEARLLAPPQGAPRRRPTAGSVDTDRAPLSFTSADGLAILVGRSGADNDRITFTIARGGDLWLHVRDYPGSHVVVRLPRGKPCPTETLLDAAHLAVHFSKIRGATTAAVTHTPRKHISRIRNAPPGKVALSRASTLELRIEPGRLERLFGKTSGEGMGSG